jgi:hypothetical protein
VIASALHVPQETLYTPPNPIFHIENQNGGHAIHNFAQQDLTPLLSAKDEHIQDLQKENLKKEERIKQLEIAVADFQNQLIAALKEKNR